MAWGRRKFFSGSNKNVATSTLGGIVALALALYVFSKVLTVVYSVVNSTDTYFGTAMTFMQSLLPVIGIIAAFLIIKNAIKKMSF